MIYKSYLVEQNFKTLKSNLVLFYGENLGLIDEFKAIIKNNYKTSKLLIFDQEEILKNEEAFFSEVNNISLFEDKKVFFINNVNDKFLQIIDECKSKIDSNKIYLFANILEKKSKLRNLFEKEKDLNVIPCYQDNEISIKNFILNNLKGFSNVSPQMINLLIDSCSYNRSKLKNEIEKIKAYFLNKSINLKDLTQLLNIKEDDDFNLINNSALSGKKELTNKLLNSTYIDDEKTIFYTSIINNRLEKLKTVISEENNRENIETIVNRLRPPVFWKDKPVFIEQLKIWNLKKINKALDESYQVEITIKSNSNIVKKTVIKKFILDICNLANAS